MTRGDVATPLMGPVFRIQRDLFVKPLDWGAEKSTRDGEWPSLSYCPPVSPSQSPADESAANFVLSRRFGERPRPYVAHFARTLPVATMRELVDLWPDEFAQVRPLLTFRRLTRRPLPFLDLTRSSLGRPGSAAGDPSSRSRS